LRNCGLVLQETKNIGMDSFQFSLSESTPGGLADGVLRRRSVCRARIRAWPTFAFPGGRLGLWTAIGFTRGPFGFVGMLSVLEWPALEEVPACGRSSMVTRDSCEHCSKPFTPPRADGRSTRTHHALKTFRTREWAPPAGRVEGCHRCFCTPHPPLRGPFSLGEEFAGNVFRIPYVSF